ncbi:PAS domain-containing protein [Streptomyces violaceusniger]|uniref:PAS domain-containing protein n=1 Tax=Streptomyces violaceusniger TaxID=68280 RepID=UPI0009C3CDC4|nr:PAS domain-containing protein [Streptomyces hygroscopicus]AQW46615.1 protein phosphatase [Streptomyces hygroscopicus]
MSDDWRIAFVNLEAERILGAPEEQLIGRVLWELPAVQQMPGLKDRYQRAAEGSTPTGFDVWTRDTDRCFHLRVVPLPDGTTCYATDVTEKRRREAEDQAAERAAAERVSAWGLDHLTMTTELLASELVGNVVRHAKGPVRLRLLRTDCLVCEVSDGSLTTPRIRRALETDESGRGLQLVAALAQRWGTRYTATGKCIWTEQSLLGPGADARAA